MRPGPDQPRELLSGTVERVTFHSPETGFCVLRVSVRSSRDLVTVVGHAAAIAAGEHVHVHNIRSDYTPTYTIATAKGASAQNGDRP